jgi:type II secretory pathway pseudopilin PulG
MIARTLVAAAVIAVASGAVLAKLPAPTDAQKAAAAAGAAKAAYGDKMGAYQLCEAENRVAAKYLAAEKAKGKAITPQLTKPCEKPAPFESAAAAAAPAPAAAVKSPAPAAAAKK